MLKNSIICTFFIFLFFNVSAKDFGPDVSVYNGQMLKWDDYKKGYGYHVMFKSLLADYKTCLGEVLIEPYSLDVSHVPSDAYVEKAFLIWTGAQPVKKIDESADNQVVLSFESTDGNIKETQTVTTTGHKVSEPQGFEFDAFIDPDEPDISYFTYRVDVTDFFKEIHESGRAAEFEYDGYSLYGNYTVSGLDCSDGENAVSNWAIILIYSLKEISPKAVYLYDGFRQYRNETAETAVRGFELWEDPEINITLLSSGGEPAEDQNNENSLEGFAVRGEKEIDWIFLNDDCNPETDVFNSISSVYSWDWDWGYNEPVCTGGDPKEPYPDELEYSMDVDTFIMDSATDGNYATHFNKGGTEINIRIGSNQDRIITNMLIVATDLINPTPDFDIPMQPEMRACTPSLKQGDDYQGYWDYTDLEYTFVIFLQNWGKKNSPPVSVQTYIPASMDYVPNSTEMANKFSAIGGKHIADEWVQIPDLENSGFPLESGFQVTETMKPCGDGSSDCDTVFVRFRTKLHNGLPKTTVFEATAVIHAEGFQAVKTNLGMPYKLKPDGSGCVEKQEEVDLADCGGSVISENEDIDTETADEDTDEDTSETKSDSGCTVLVF
ncbi:MAG TPA: hypothetical protein PLZ43_11505 [bacterium]|nr:hypothetical protein [bacterium]